MTEGGFDGSSFCCRKRKAPLCRRWDQPAGQASGWSFAGAAKCNVRHTAEAADGTRRGIEGER